MKKTFNFDLSVQANALNCPNPSEWYDKAYLAAVDPKYFKVVPGVKDSTKVATTSFPSVLQALDCQFAATSNSLDATTVSVCPLKVNVSICKKDIEDSFVVNEMRAGSQNYTVEAFMAYYWETLQKEVSQEISVLMWQGDTAISYYTGTTAYLKLCNGYSKKLKADAGVVDVAKSAVTSSNVISILGTVIQAAPAAVKAKNAGGKFYVASNVALAFRIASALGNTAAFITGEMPLSYAGYEVVEQPGMANDEIVFTRSENLVYAFDGSEDDKNLVAIDQLKTAGIPNILTVALLSLGFEILNPTEIVYFN
jgi:hypothetical protein